MITSESIRNYLLFVATILLVLAFPIQVMVNSPFPAVMPYIIILLLMIPAIGICSGQHSFKYTLSIHKKNNIDLMVILYGLIFFVNSFVQLTLTEIDVKEIMSSIVNYVAPVSFYLFFRNRATDRDIRFFLLSISISGLVVGIYFAYDSILKLALGEVTEYAQLAFEYSNTRSGIDFSEANNSRIAIGSRSSGLLQSHTISGAWVVLGALATLALVPRACKLIRLFVIVIFGVFLVLGLNFSNIVAYVVIILLLEFHGWRLFFLKIPKRFVADGVGVLFILLLITSAAYFVMNESMIDMVINVTKLQIDIVFGSESAENTLGSIAFGGLMDYLARVSVWPVVLLWGDGFTSFGYQKGGDFGVMETVAHFGLTFYVLIIVGFLKLIRSSLCRMLKLEKFERNEQSGDKSIDIVKFAIGFTFLIIILDLHYSAWTAKSLLPIIFAVLALYGRISSLPARDV